jgi:parallel beta-helix repeat protein
MCIGACDGSGAGDIDLFVDTAYAYYGLIPSGTSWGNALTIQAYPGESIVLKPTGGDVGIRIFDGTKYTIWKDFAMDGSLLASGANNDGIRIGDYNNNVAGNSYNRFQNIEISYYNTNGVLTFAPHNEFINLHVHHTGQEAGGHGIYLCGSHVNPDSSSYTLIDGGEIDHQLSATRRQRFAIQVYNNVGAGEYASGNVTIRNVKIHDNNNGIVMMGGSGNLIYNNLIYDNTYDGVSPYNAGTSSWYNNTIVGNGDHAAIISYSSITATFRNNIFYGNGTDGIDNAAGGTLTQSSNLTANPLFVSSGDFHLQAGSPAIGTGVNLYSTFTTDYTGTSRPTPPTAWDAGAYKFVVPGAPHGLILGNPNPVFHSPVVR